MAKTKIFTVLAMLFASSVALADNSVYIEQAGSSNTVSITQVGSTNKVGGKALSKFKKGDKTVLVYKRGADELKADIVF